LENKKYKWLEVGPGLGGGDRRITDSSHLWQKCETLPEKQTKAKGLGVSLKW
jgi:hypothetical protein